MTRTRTNRTPASGRARAVSKPHDPAEVQADKAADVVARGGSVSGWSFGSVPVAADVHREEKGKGDDDPKKEAAKKTLEALAETKVAKDLQEKAKETPLVKKATEFVGTTPGKIVAGGAIAAGVGGLAAAKQPLPFQAPAVPIPKVPGLSAQVKVEGPVNAPTFVGLSLTYKEQGPKTKGKKDDSTMAERAAAFRAQRAGLTESFKSQAQKDQDQADEQAQLGRLLASQQKLFGQSTLLPLKPGDKPKTVDVPKTEPSEPQKEKEEAPVQREPASTAEQAPVADTSRVDGAVRGGGRPLDAATRRSMEARFGYDFSSVRIHDDAAASSAAADVSATAFTVGEDVVLGGGYDPTTPRGRHLIAHELAHVVQQRGVGQSDGEHLHRRSIFESIGILLGLAEGTWTDQELRAYLDALTSSGHIDKSYDADNKARAIVRKWKQSAPGWDLLGPQKALLIDEMIHGPTLGEDEECILDLLELSDAGDLRVIFADSQKRTLSLEDNIQDDNRKRLNAFEASRFLGGRTELLAGRVNVVGDPVPAGAPSFAFAAATFDARLESDRTSAEMIALIDRFTPDDRKKALDHLLFEVWPKLSDEVAKAELTKAEAPTEDARKAIEKRTDPMSEKLRKAERIREHYFGSDVPATAAALEKGTAAVDPLRRQELRDVLRPKRYGAKATFDEPEKYRAAIEKALPGIIEDKYRRKVTNGGTRGTADEIERMAPLAKHETDDVFGAFYDPARRPELAFPKPGPPGKAGTPGKLHLWYEQAVLHTKQFGELDVAHMWLLYYFQSDRTLRALNDVYAAAPAFDESDAPKNREAKVIAEIVDKAVKNKETVRKLNETFKNWGGMADKQGNIFVDLFHKPEVVEDRKAFWDMFQTLMHEYLHTLAHRDYQTYAESFGSSSNEYNTLIEGVDSMLDEVVWEHVAPRLKNDSIRKVVEGDKYSRLPAIDVPPPHRYPSYAEAFRLVSLVGIKNVYAAYFLGKVDRISVTKAAADKAAKAKAKAGQSGQPGQAGKGNTSGPGKGGAK